MSTTDASLYLGGLESDVLAQWRRKSQNALYREEPEAWLWDVLGYRWHAKQREFVHAFMEQRRIAVKSANGTGKSRGVGELISWGISVHEPGELLIICSAPTMRQIEETIFGYISSNYSRMRGRGIEPIGRLTSSAWSYQETPTSRPKTLVLGQKPSDKDIVGSFQGIRAIDGSDDGNASKTWVFIDEAGAVHKDLFVAAESVTTGAGDNKIMAIGNPDNLGTYFHSIFTDVQIGQDWYTETLAAKDLPTFTGEIVYEDEAMQKRMLESGMIDAEWVEQKKRAWGEDSARYRSKVMGEFPDSDDRSFFSQSAIDTAHETNIPEDMQNDLSIGFDVARFGEDDSALYGNRGGRIRRIDKWSKANANESASRAHQKALDEGARFMIIDSTGLGGPIADVITARGDRYYTVIMAQGAERSPDPARWLNMRAYWYDMLREGMLTGQVDLDYSEEDGKQLKDELLTIQYDFTLKGAIKIESKKDMAARGVKSPDLLDAVVYSYVNAQALVGHPLAGMKPGDYAYYDPWEELDGDRRGLPI